MNTRIQVEHPVTEMVTGIDLIKEQLKIAAGEKLKITQDKVQIKGAAMECRINAEDPDHNFRPCPGKIEQLILPGGNNIRIDTHVYPGYTISPYYDSMIAKIIAYGKNRQEVISTMNRALRETVVSPLKTTVGMHQFILGIPRFIRGKFSTSFIDTVWEGRNKK